MKLLILAGGYGTRLGQAGEQLPKPLVRVGDQPIIWHVMQLYARHGVTDFVVCLGYLQDEIRRFFNEVAGNTIPAHWKVQLLDTGLDTMTGGRIARAARELRLNERFCVSYADGVGDVDITRAIETHRRCGRQATLCAVHPPPRFGILDLKDDQVVAFAEKRSTKNAWISGGYFVLEPSVLELIDGDTCVFEKGPIEHLVREGQLSVHRHEGFWRPMDTMVDKRYLDELCADGSAPWLR